MEHWLDLSAGFVHAQVSRSSHRGVVVSHNATEHRDAFPYRPVWRLDPLHRHLPERRWRPIRTRVLRAIAAAHRSTVVHVHFGYVVNDVVDMVRESGLPLVLSLHGEDTTALPVRQPGHYAAATEVADAVVVPSRHFAALAENLGFAAERIHVIPSGVDTRFFTPTALPADPVVAFVGRLVEKKGLDVLLAAWPAVREAVPRARLDILGEGPLADLLPAGDASIRRLLPQPARRAEQVRDLLRSAAVVASPSRTATSGDAESLLLVNLEAQASGRPLITTRHGGIPEFVDDGGSALLVRENDPAALASSLVAVLTDNELAARMAAAGPAVAARFDVAACAARMDRLYEELSSRPVCR